jgi:hypothetical protein
MIKIEITLILCRILIKDNQEFLDSLSPSSKESWCRVHLGFISTSLGAASISVSFFLARFLSTNNFWFSFTFGYPFPCVLFFPLVMFSSFQFCFAHMISFSFMFGFPFFFCVLPFFFFPCYVSSSQSFST